VATAVGIAVERPPFTVVVAVVDAADETCVFAGFVSAPPSVATVTVTALGPAWTTATQLAVAAGGCRVADAGSDSSTGDLGSAAIACVVSAAERAAEPAAALSAAAGAEPRAADAAVSLRPSRLLRAGLAGMSSEGPEAISGWSGRGVGTKYRAISHLLAVLTPATSVPRRSPNAVLPSQVSSVLSDELTL
jgi:hypothetical protein